VRRRQFLRAVGLVVASAASCVSRSRAQRDGRIDWFVFRRLRAAGRPMALVSVGSDEDRLGFLAAQEAIRTGPDRDLAVRRILVALLPMSDGDLLRTLTNERPKFDAPSVVLVDGEPPRVIKNVKLDRANMRAGLERFLRDTVSLDKAWLEPRVALLELHLPDVVTEVRARMASGRPVEILGLRAAAVVVLESLRRTGAAREALISELLAAAPAPAPPRRDDVDLLTIL